MSVIIEIVSNFLNDTDYIQKIAIFAAATLVVLNTFKLFSDKEIPISHKIAIIGLPCSGKTTLITALFELIQRGDADVAVRLHGGKTINRVNKNIALLNSGFSLGKTVENDAFVFRFSYTRKKLFIRYNYDVEIADFPGEYSQKMIKGDSPDASSYAKAHEQIMDDDDFSYVLFDKEFFSWIASSQEYLFVIDLADIFGSERPYAKVADMSARIRSSWQVIEDAVSERGFGKARSRPVHIIFSKVDCLGDLDLSYMFSNTMENRTDDSMIEKRGMIKNNGFIDDMRVTRIVDSERISEIQYCITSQFSDIIMFFEHRSVKVNLIISSVVWMENNKARLGVRQLLNGILP